MSNTDRVQFNTLERAVSTDWNDVQSKLGRIMLEELQYATAGASWSTAAFPTETNGHAVLGGLILGASGSDVTVSPGALAQYSSTLLPALGPLDSTMRLGINRATATLTTPAPGSDTYYLVTAQMQEVVTNETRDVFNPGTQTFAATPGTPKQGTRGLAFRFEAGTSTNFPVPSDPDWRIIGGVFRPAGGGAVTAAHLFDMRRILEAKINQRVDMPGSLWQRNYATGAYGTATLTGACCTKLAMFDAEGQLNGQRAWFHLLPGYELPILDASHADPVNVPSAAAAKSWFYMYLCPFSSQDVMPVGQPLSMQFIGAGAAVQHTPATRGVLVTSTVPPGNGAGVRQQGAMSNSATINLPAPFANWTVPEGKALFLGAFRRATSHTASINPAKADGGRVVLVQDVSGDLRMQSIVAAMTPPSTPIALQAGDANWPTMPASARALCVKIEWFTVSGSSSLGVQESATSGGTFNPIMETMNARTDGVTPLYFTTHLDVSTVNPAVANGKLTQFFLAGGSAGDSVTVFCEGFVEAI